MFAGCLFGCVDTAHAKGAIDEIVITGGRLGSEIKIHRDHQTLSGFDPWSGGFMDRGTGPVEAPRDQDSSYEVLFLMKWPARQSKADRDGLQLIYNVRYCPGRDGGPGYIYLPGTDDKYSVNLGTIIREGDDGRWHQASAAWEALMKRSGITTERAPLQSNIRNSWRRPIIQGAGAIALAGGVFMLALIIQRKRKRQGLATVR